MVDIHSHILPNMDDGAKDLNEAVTLLEMMAADGIDDVFATSHFYPMEDNAAGYKADYDESFAQLKAVINSRDDLPKIHRGCEMLYFEGIGRSDSIKQFCYENTNILLMETVLGHAGEGFQNDVRLLKYKWGIETVIAHIERYAESRSFDSLIAFCKKEGVKTQVNAASFGEKYYDEALDKLIRADVVTYLGTDTHSPVGRPPKMANAIKIISEKYGDNYAERLIKNSEEFLQKVLSEGKP